MAKLFLTGASGFVGSGLARASGETRCVTLGRSELPPGLTAAVERHHVRADFGSVPNWDEIIGDADCFFHLASQNATISKSSREQIASFRDGIVGLTTDVLHGWACSSCPAFVYVSTIKARSPSLDEESEPYAYYKREAEKVVCQFAADHPTRTLVIVRPPLVCHLTAKNSFGALVRLVRKGIPLPLNGMPSRRSLISRSNLASFFLSLADQVASGMLASKEPGVPLEFEVSDGDPLTTKQIISSIATCIEVPNRSFYFPSSILLGALRVLKKTSIADAFSDDMIVDPKLRPQFWTPPKAWPAAIAL